jgi:glycerol-3-phosphate dehydrogenase
VPSAAAVEALAKRDPEAAARELRALMVEESALTLDDLMLRRTDWGMLPETDRRLRELLAGLPGLGNRND